MKCKNNNQVFNTTTLFEIMKNQKKFIILFTFLVTLAAIIYRYQLVQEYDKNPLYKGSLHIKLGVCFHYDAKNIENSIHIYKFKLKKYLNKESDVIVTFPHPSIRNEMILNVFQEDNTTIEENLNKTLELLHQIELEIYTDILSKLEHNPKINSVKYSHPIKKINIEKQDYSVNHYFILCTFLLGFITSTILSVFLNKID